MGTFEKVRNLILIGSCLTHASGCNQNTSRIEGDFPQQPKISGGQAQRFQVNADQTRDLNKSISAITESDLTQNSTHAIKTREQIGIWSSANIALTIKNKSFPDGVDNTTASLMRDALYRVNSLLNCNMSSSSVTRFEDDKVSALQALTALEINLRSKVNTSSISN